MPAIAQPGTVLRSIGPPAVPVPGGYTWRPIPGTASRPVNQPVTWDFKVVKSTKPPPKPKLSGTAKVAGLGAAVFVAYLLFG